MNFDPNDDLSFLEELQGLIEENQQVLNPEKKQKASFQAEKLEERVLFSATWIDADTGDELDGPTDGNDLFTGTDGRDIAAGGGGNDILDGLGGSDNLSGGDGDDILDGGAGNDRLYGGAGDDVVKGGDGVDFLYGDDGDDQLLGGSGNDYLYDGAGADTMDGGDGADWAFYYGSQEGVEINLETGVSSGGTAEGDVLRNIENIGGSTSDDILVGDDGANFLYGNRGDDQISGGDGNDILYDFQGSNELSGGDGNDTIYVGGTDNTVDAGDGNDRVYVFSGNTNVDAGAGDDIVNTSRGNDVIEGGAGDDTINGAAGTDTAIYSGNWSDYDITDNGDGSHTITDSRGIDGTDTVRNVESFNFSDGVLDVSELVNEAPQDLELDNSTVAENSTAGTVVGVLSTADSNNLDSHNYQIVDVDGNVVEDANFEIVDGEVRVKAGADLNFEADDSHQLNIRVTDSEGESFTESLEIEVTNVNEGQIAQGESFSFDEDGSVSGNLLANDVDIDGDVLHVSDYSQPANGTVVVEANGDFFYQPAENFNGTDSFTYEINDGNGATTTLTVELDVVAVNDAVADLSLSNSSVAENSPTGTVVGSLTATDVDNDDTFSYEIVDADGNVVEDANFEIVDGEVRVKAGADLNFEADDSHQLNIRVTDSGNESHTEAFTIEIGDVDETIYGTAGRDILTGTDDGDVIFGRAGNDVIRGGDGDDQIHGEEGYDYLLGGSGDDHLYGGQGNDYLYGGDGADVLDGGEGSDWAYFYDSNEGINVDLDTGTVSGGNAEGDTLISIENIGGTVHDDVIVGNDQANFLYGNRGDDQLSGGAGNDIVYDFQGSNELSGGDGNDTIYAGGTDNQVDAGSGNDRAYVFSGDASVDLGDGNDSLYGLYSSGDIDVNAGDGNDTIRTGRGDDTIEGGAGDDNIDGGQGNNVATYSGNWSDYNISDNGDGSYTISDTRGLDGTDTVRNVQSFEFADGVVDVTEIVNEAPTDLEHSSCSIAENSLPGTVVGVLSTSDSDALDAHTYEIVDGDGNVVEDANFEVVDGEIRVKAGADLNFEAADSHQLNVRVTDSAGETYTESLEIEITNVNEGQIAQGESFSTDEDGSVSGNLLENDVDIDGDQLQVSNYSQPEHGSVVVDANGDFVYEPADNFSGTDSFTYEISDGNGATTTLTVELDVEAVADAAILNTSGASGDEDTAIELDISAVLADVDGSESIADVTISGVPSGAQLSAGVDNGDGSWTLEPSDLDGLTITPAENSADDFDLTVSVTTAESSGAEPVTVETSMHVNVEAVADAAVFNTSGIDLDGSGYLMAENVDSFPQDQFTIEIEFNSSDKGNAGTLFSYAVPSQQNEVILFNYQNLSVYVGGQSISTGLSLTDGQDHDLSVTWDSETGQVTVYDHGEVVYDSGDHGTSLNRGYQIHTGGTIVIGQEQDAVGGGFDGSQSMKGELYGVKMWDSALSGQEIATGVSESGNVVTDIRLDEGTGSSLNDASGNLEFGVHGGADWLEGVDNLQTQEDTSVSLRLSNLLQDTDGSESLDVSIENVPEGVVLTDGVNSVTSDGSAIDVSDWNLSNLKVTPVADSAEDFDLTVVATTTEAENGDSATVSETFHVEVDAVADTARLQLNELDTSGIEFEGTGYLMAENIDQLPQDQFTIQFDFNSDDTSRAGTLFSYAVNGRDNEVILFNTQSLSVYVGGQNVNTGLSLADGEDHRLAVSWESETGQVVVYDHGEVVYDSADHGTSLNQGYQIRSGGTLAIAQEQDRVGGGFDPNQAFHGEINSFQIWNDVLDETQLSGDSIHQNELVADFQFVGGDDGLVDTTNNMSLSISGDAHFNHTTQVNEDQPLALDLSTVGEDTDGSEQLSVVVSGIPEGATISDGIHSIVADGSDLDVASWDRANITIVAPENSDADFDLNVRVTTTESENGDSSSYNEQIHVNVLAVADDATLNVSNATGDEDTAIELDITAALNDLDGSEEISNVTISGVPVGAQLSSGIDNGDGSWTLVASDLDGLQVTPAENSHDDFELEVEVTTTDGNDSATVGQTMVVTVAAVNDAVSDLDLSNKIVTENSPAGTIVGSLSATDIDNDDTFTYEIVDDDGNVVQDANFEIVDGEVRVKAGADLNFESATSHELNIRVTDSGGETHTETMAIEVTNVNEGQIAQGESFTTDEDGLVSGNLLANDIDIDGDELHVSEFSQPAGGTVSVDANGDFVYQPTENFSGTDSFTYEVSDGNGASTTLTVELEVAAVADEAIVDVSDALGNEDKPIDLSISASLFDVDGSESISNIQISGLPEGASLSTGIDNGDGSWSLSPEQLDGLQLNISGLGNADFDLTVEVTTSDGDTEAVRSETLAVELKHDTLANILTGSAAIESGESVATTDSTNASENTTSFDAQNVEFESAFAEPNAFVGDFAENNSEQDIWNQQDFGSVTNTFETERQEAESGDSVAEADNSQEQPKFEIESFELPDPNQLTTGQVEEFDNLSLFDMPVEVSDIASLGESVDTANLTTASLLMMFTTREDSRRKLLKLHGERKKSGQQK